MTPEVYLYRIIDSKFELYLGGISTLQGLSLFDSKTEVKLLHLGATCYKNHGWATEESFPKFQVLGELISYLESEGDIGIIEFKIALSGIGELSSHDDGECHLIFESQKDCLDFVKKVAPDELSGQLIHSLIKHQNLYITITQDGRIYKHHSFEDYLGSLN